MNTSGKRYTTEFKEQAVKLLVTSGKTQVALARELGISEVSLGTWKKQAFANSDKPHAKGPKISLEVVQAENRRLKQENETLRRQREILKKSLGILSEEPLQKSMPS